MKKPTLGQLSLGFFAASSFCFVVSFFTSSLDLFLEIIFLPSLLLAIFFVSAALANQVKDRGQMPIAVVILVSGFLVFVVPALLLIIGSISPPTPDDVNTTEPFKEIEDALDILRFYGAALLVFFFSVIAGLLVNNKKLSQAGDILTKLTFLAVAISLLFNLSLIFGLISFLDNLETGFGLIFLTLLLAAITGIFRLEARKDPMIKTSISFDKEDLKKEPRSTVIPPPSAAQKAVGPKPPTLTSNSESTNLPNQTTSLPNQGESTSLPSQIEHTDLADQAESPNPPNQVDSTNLSSQVSPESEIDQSGEEKSPFAKNLTELNNPIFQEIKTESTKPDQPDANQQIKPGWYQDPNDENFIRYWDGAAWTSHRQAK